MALLADLCYVVVDQLKASTKIMFNRSLELADRQCDQRASSLNSLHAQWESGPDTPEISKISQEKVPSIVKGCMHRVFQLC